MERLFDPEAFRSLVLQKIKRDGLTIRGAADQAGVSRTAFHNLTTGSTPVVENYLRLVRWLET